MEPKIDLKVGAMSVVSLTRKQRELTVGSHDASDPSPIAIKAVVTFGLEFIARFKSSAVIPSVHRQRQSTDRREEER